MVQKITLSIGITLVGAYLFVESVPADVIHLTHGGSIEVDEWRDAGDAIELTIGGGTMHIPKADVRQIERTPTRRDLPASPAAAPASAAPRPDPGSPPAVDRSTMEEPKAVVRSPEEQRTFSNVMLIAWLENLCRHSLGRYVPLEQLVAGCGHVRLAEENSPARDPDYEYRLSVRGDSLELSVMPRRPGLGGFFSDGRKIYYNPAGPASPRDYRNVMEAPGAR